MKLIFNCKIFVYKDYRSENLFRITVIDYLTKQENVYNCIQCIICNKITGDPREAVVYLCCYQLLQTARKW